jgi:hypothetical protein
VVGSVLAEPDASHVSKATRSTVPALGQLEAGTESWRGGSCPIVRAAKPAVVYQD